MTKHDGRPNPIVKINCCSGIAGLGLDAAAIVRITAQRGGARTAYPPMQINTRVNARAGLQTSSLAHRGARHERSTMGDRAASDDPSSSGTPEGDPLAGGSLCVVGGRCLAISRERQAPRRPTAVASVARAACTRIPRWDMRVRGRQMESSRQASRVLLESARQPLASTPRRGVPPAARARISPRARSSIEKGGLGRWTRGANGSIEQIREFGSRFTNQRNCF